MSLRARVSRIEERMVLLDTETPENRRLRDIRIRKIMENPEAREVVWELYRLWRGLDGLEEQDAGARDARIRRLSERLEELIGVPIRRTRPVR